MLYVVYFFSSSAGFYYDIPRHSGTLETRVTVVSGAILYVAGSWMIREECCAEFILPLSVFLTVLDASLECQAATERGDSGATSVSGSCRHILYVLFYCCVTTRTSRRPQVDFRQLIATVLQQVAVQQVALYKSSDSFQTDLSYSRDRQSLKTFYSVSETKAQCELPL